MAELEQVPSTDCCSTDAQEACCEPSEKAACCGEPGDGAVAKCGCKAG
jgi:hypothetical protein